MSRRRSASRPSTRPPTKPRRRPDRTGPRAGAGILSEVAGGRELLGKRAVVTGASSGIGRAIALELAAGGADVVVAARASREGADETARLIRDMGRAAAVVMADLGTAAGCRDLLRAAWSELERVDIWVNNAGADILTGEGAELDYEEKLERLLKVDVQATVRLSRAAGLRMRTAGGGCIIN